MLSKRTYAKMRRSIRRSRKMVRGGGYTYDGIITKDVIFEQSSPGTTEYISAIERAYIAKDFNMLKQVLDRPNRTINFYCDLLPGISAYKKLIDLPDVPGNIKEDLKIRVKNSTLYGQDDIKEADIKEADIKKADIKKADIKEADIKEADIKKADTNLQISEELIKACEDGDLGKVQQLITDGADINSKNKLGETLLELACKNSRTSVADFLLTKGVKPDIIGYNGFSVLHRACGEEGYLHIVELLLSKGATVDIKNDEGTTPLHTAAAINNEAVLKYLIDHGADVNSADDNGYTPLHMACGNGFEASVNLLINRGANINMKDIDGLTPLQMALDKGFMNVADILVSAGAGIDKLSKQQKADLEEFMKKKAGGKMRSKRRTHKKRRQKTHKKKVHRN
jgi:ankyrin repeat protein